MTSQQSWGPKTMKRRPCWPLKPILWGVELLSYVKTLFCANQSVWLLTGHVSENTLLHNYYITIIKAFFNRTCQFEFRMLAPRGIYIKIGHKLISVL